MNCYINDLFHHIELANLNAYANPNDERLSTRLTRIPKNLTEDYNTK